MSYKTNLRALASVIANVAPETQLARAAESCTYSQAEYRRYEWFMSKAKVSLMGDEVAVFFPVGRYSSESRGYGWATGLIERSLEMLDGGPYEIPLEAGLITDVRPGLVTYRAA